LHRVLLPMMSNKTDQLLDFDTLDISYWGLCAGVSAASLETILQPISFCFKKTQSLSPDNPRGQFSMPDCGETMFMPWMWSWRKNERFRVEDSSLYHVWDCRFLQTVLLHFSPHQAHVC
jgi:hypothetical protein